MDIPSGGGTTPPHTDFSHQNVALRRGRHSSPREGACVVELASMLAGEPFSDHPRSVCPVLGSYMRTLNDGLDDEARQELYRYAAEIVGSRDRRRVRWARMRACARWSRQIGAISGIWVKTLALWGSPRALGALCARAALESPGGQSLAFALADGLIAIGRPRGDGARPEELPERRVAGAVPTA